jgi:ribonucleoside-diphosphate reductase alpha chain
MKAVANEDPWDLKWRTSGETARTVPSKRLWDKITMSSWQSADPGLQFDTTINEWHTCPQSGRINASNPCSEYMFLDDTACNLASLNLMKFFDEENQLFKVDDYLHAIRIWTIILEISVLMAHYPSQEMAQKSYDFRTLGLGYANLGTLLMVNGIPYDSPEALAWTGAITAMLTGEAYATSAEMSKDVGTFEYFNLNREDMLRVIRNHRRAAYNAIPSEYEGLTIRPMGINPKFVPDILVDAAREAWDRALALGEKYGFRNAQVSVLAPTGTIGLIMDCDTTGVEPDFAIVKFKKLAGGGYFKIVNQSVRKALRKLNFSEHQITEIENYAKGHGTLTGCPHININSLIEKGFSEDKIELIESQLPNVFDIRFAFNKFTLGEEYLKSLGLSEAAANSNNLLKELGFSEKQIDEANDYICGTMMLEGAPNLTDDILPIFDTASKCGKNGKRYIEYMAHVKIMAAAQPFIFGAISKTVNMPTEATVSEIGTVYTQAWKQMLKAIAIYRDSSKLSQPLNTKIDSTLVEEITLSDDKFEDEKYPNEIVTNKPDFRRPIRQKLPPKRHGNVREAVINTHKVYIRTGEYSDGTLGEIFIDMYKEGAAFRGLLNSFAILVSKALQYGIPLEELVDTFTFTRFEPSGIVQGHERIKNSTSVLDFIFRSLAVDYLNREDLAHVPAPESEEKTEQLSLQFGGNDSLSETISNISDEKQSSQILTTGEKRADSAHLSDNDFQVESSKSNTNLTQPEFNYSEAITLGFTGEQCDNCGSMRVKKNGTCSVCLDCGHTTGCS